MTINADNSTNTSGTLLAVGDMQDGQLVDFRLLARRDATLRGIRAIQTIKNGHVYGKEPDVMGDIRFVESFCGLAAR